MDEIRTESMPAVEKGVEEGLEEAKRFLGPRIKRVPYVREYPKNFKKTWKEFQKALSASEEFSLMWFLNLVKVLKDEGVVPSGPEKTTVEQFITKVAIQQALVILHPYDITTNKMLLHYLKKNGITIG